MNPANTYFQAIATEAFWKFMMKIALPLLDYDWHLAEDFVQQTFVILWKTKRYDPEKSAPSTYAIRRLRGMINHYHENCRSTEWRKRRYFKEQLGFSTNTDEVEFLDELEQVRSAIERLSLKRREAINRYEREETLQDVASGAGVTREAIRIRECRAVIQLREMLKAA